MSDTYTLELELSAGAYGELLGAIDDRQTAAYVAAVMGSEGARESIVDLNELIDAVLLETPPEILPDPLQNDDGEIDEETLREYMGSEPEEGEGQWTSIDVE